MGWGGAVLVLVVHALEGAKQIQSISALGSLSDRLLGPFPELVGPWQDLRLGIPSQFPTQVVTLTTFEEHQPR